MNEFKEYKRTNVAEMRIYEEGEDFDGISISDPDKENGSPKAGDMIARNPDNHKDQWLVAKDYFYANFAAMDDGMKTLKNTTTDGASKIVRDIKFWGDGDNFRLISKAWSEKEGWMKSTKAMEIPNRGVLVQVTTQQWDNVAEALIFIPSATIIEIKDSEGNVTSRKIV